MLEPGRKYSAGNGYRYEFNGKEKDNETKTQDYGLRIYDPRLGRFLSVDPFSAEYPWNSSYAFAENDVIRAIDIEGAEKYIKTNYRNASGVLYMTKIQCITNNQTGKAVELNFHNATGKLTTYEVYESDVYANGKIVDITREKKYRDKLSYEELKIVNKQNTVRSQEEAPRESDPFDNNIFYENYIFQKGTYSSDIFNGDENAEQMGAHKITMPKPKSKPKVMAPNVTTKPETKSETKSLASIIAFNNLSRHVDDDYDYKSEINKIVSMVKAPGVTNYSIVILGNVFRGGSFEKGGGATGLGVFTIYSNYGELALARANTIKDLLVANGLNATNIVTQLGDPNKGMNADYKITTETVK